MDGYMRLGELRPEFDQWLKAEGFDQQLIVTMRFDEGYVDAECRRQIDGKITLDTEWKRLPWTTPPPASVIKFAARYDGRADG